MFKKSKKLNELMKKQLALILSIVMAIGCLSSAGFAFSSVHALPVVNDGGITLAETSVDLINRGLSYVGSGAAGTAVDNNGFINLALNTTYGTTNAYFVENNGGIDFEPVLVDGQKQYINIGSEALGDLLENHIGDYLCIEGNGVKTYYFVVAANEVSDSDITRGGVEYNSYIARSGKFTGSIVSYRGKSAIALGHYDSVDEAAYDYNSFAENATWSDAAYDYGEMYTEKDTRYWFGKTFFAYAQDAANGVMISNIHTPGDLETDKSGEKMVILQSYAKPTLVDAVIEQYSSDGSVLSGVTYDVYTDSECTTRFTSLEIVDGRAQFNAETGTYYLKQTAVPEGYELTTEIIPIKLSGKNEVVKKLYLSPKTNNVSIQVVDKNDTGRLLKYTILTLEEWDNRDNEYKPVSTLGYNKYSQSFVIDKEYTNTNGDVIKDRNMHASPVNDGKFRIVETTAHPGYVSSEFVKEINVDDSKLELEGATAVKDTAKFIVTIKSVNSANEPVDGSKFAITYNGTQYNSIDATDLNGITYITNGGNGILETNGLIAKIQQSMVKEGYIQRDDFISGVNFAFAKEEGVIRDGAFETTLIIPVLDDPNYVAFQKGKVVIKKVDNTDVTDLGNVGIAGAKYTLYTDADCTIVAKDINNNPLSGLTTDANGEVVADNLKEGTYYIKEVGTVDGYAACFDVKPVIINKDERDENGLVVKNVKFGVERQLVSLSMIKKDKASGRAVPNAVFALYASQDIVTPSLKQTIKKNTLLGYYKTNAEGKIFVDTIGTESFEVNGTNYDAIYPLDINGTHVDDGSPLPNAKYYFVEVEPAGQYVVDNTHLEFDASYVKNESLSGVDTDNYSVSVKGLYLIMAEKEFLGVRQNAEIKFSIKDAEVVHPSSHYNVSNATYNALADNKTVASYDGVTVHLYTKDNVIDIETGNVIPADTFVGMYPLVNGQVDIAEFNAAEYAGHKIPNGVYRLTIDHASVGYTVAEKSTEVSVNYDNTKTTVEGTASIDETVFRQHIKVTSKTERGELVSGTKFHIYSVAEIIDKCNVTSEGLPWNESSEKVNGFFRLTTSEVLALVNGRVEPTQTIISDEGVAKTRTPLVFGDYIVVPEVDSDYSTPDSIYIRIPSDGGDFELPTTDTADFEIVSKAKRFIVAAKSSLDGTTSEGLIPVVKKGDKFIYKLSVSNVGETLADGIIIYVPRVDGLKFIKENIPSAVESFTLINDGAYISVRPVEAGSTVNIDIPVEVTAQSAAIYTISALYGRADEVNYDTFVNDCTREANNVQVQSVSFVKSAEIAGGTSDDDATTVSVGDEITYTFALSADGIVNKALLVDEIPDGLTFVDGSIETKDENGEWGYTPTVFSYENGKISILVGNFGEGTGYIRFRARVNNIKANTSKLFKNQATLTYEKGTNVMDNIKSNIVTHIVNVKVADSEISTNIPTYIGRYDGRHDVTVLKDGDEYSFDIPIKNEGTSAIKNIVIKVKVPKNAKFVEANLDGEYNRDTNEVIWKISEIAPEKSVKFTIKCKCASGEKATELVNDVFYAIPDDVRDIQDDEWNQLDSVIYQTISAEMTSSVNGGADKDNAAAVKIGDKISYSLKLTILNKVYGLSLTDAIPAGLTLDKSSIKLTLADGTAVDTEVEVNNGVISINGIDLDAGVYTLTFDTTIDDVAEFDKDYTYENKATVSVKRNKESDEKVELESNAIFVKTSKASQPADTGDKDNDTGKSDDTSKSDTPKLGVNVSNNKAFVLGLISLISAICSIALAAYYFVNKKKSTDNG